jgi:hypothetical protein
MKLSLVVFSAISRSTLQRGADGWLTDSEKSDTARGKMEKREYAGLRLFEN